MQVNTVIIGYLFQALEKEGKHKKRNFKRYEKPYDENCSREKTIYIH